MNKKCFILSLFIFFLSSFIAYKIYMDKMIYLSPSPEDLGILNNNIVYRLDLDGEIYFGIKIIEECKKYRSASMRILYDMNDTLFYFTNKGILNSKIIHLNQIVHTLSLDIKNESENKVILKDKDYNYTITMNGCDNMQIEITIEHTLDRGIIPKRD